MDRLIDQIKLYLEEVLGDRGSRDVQYFVFGKPKNIDKGQADKGIIFIHPVRSEFMSVTTGLQERANRSLEIILAKSTKPSVYKNADKTGLEYLARVMEGEDAGGEVRNNTIKYAIRSKMKAFGLLQGGMNIAYDDDRFNSEDIVTATLNIAQATIHQQPLI